MIYYISGYLHVKPVCGPVSSTSWEVMHTNKIASIFVAFFIYVVYEYNMFKASIVVLHPDPWTTTITTKHVFQTMTNRLSAYEICFKILFLNSMTPV